MWGEGQMNGETDRERGGMIRQKEMDEQREIWWCGQMRGELNDRDAWMKREREGKLTER